MRRQLLTDIAIRSLKSPARGQVEVWDAKLPGFGVRISPQGTKSFVLLYRVAGRPRRLTLGRFPVVGLAKARKLAMEALTAVVDGEDPGADKSERSHTGREGTFGATVNEFVEAYVKRKNRRWQETAAILEREFVVPWGRRNLRDITKKDVHKVIDGIVARGTNRAANRAFAHVRKLFNWCVERGTLDQSPCFGLRMPTKEVGRDRVLSDDELGRIWAASNELGYPYGHVVQILMLSAQRRDEVASLRWSELDLQSGLWSMPADRNKSGRPHELPLTSLVVQTFTTIPRLHEMLVFPARGKDEPVSGFSKWKARLDALSQVSGWTLHDLRRTAASGMARLGVAPHVVERILNHTSGTFGGVAGVYNRFGYLPEMRAALDLWAQHVASISSAGPLVELRVASGGSAQERVRTLHKKRIS